MIEKTIYNYVKRIVSSQTWLFTMRFDENTVEYS